MNEMKVVAIKKAPNDLAARLREMADLAEAGRITEFVAAYECDGAYCFTYAASPRECVVLASCLWHSTMERMRR